MTTTGPGPLARPTLLPGLRRLWRTRTRLQLGLDPGRAVVLELPDAAAARLLDLLDGTRSERSVIAEAARCRIGEQDARAVLAVLRAAGLVVGAQTLLPHDLPDPVRRRLADEAAALALRGGPAPATPAQILRRRRAARVVVTGHGQLAGPVALALAQAGVGHVSPALDRAPAEPATAGHHPDRQLAEAIARAAPGTRTGPVRRQETSFVVQVGTTGPANLVAAGYARRRVAHLAVTVRDGTPVIGPLVPPTGAPCLNCIDLHRQDRDPGWPELAAQLATPAREPCGAAAALTAAGLAAGEVLSWLDGDTPATLGASIEVIAPARLRRRSWPPHPSCPCLRRRAGPPGPPAKGDTAHRHRGRRYGTMNP
jgi:bacteriocin biosynthesis cyclodehydratase domain-containing protein